MLKYSDSVAIVLENRCYKAYGKKYNDYLKKTTLCVCLSVFLSIYLYENSSLVLSFSVSLSAGLYHMSIFSSF